MRLCALLGNQTAVPLVLKLSVNPGSPCGLLLHAVADNEPATIIVDLAPAQYSSSWTCACQQPESNTTVTTGCVGLIIISRCISLLWHDTLFIFIYIPSELAVVGKADNKN